MQKYLTKTVSTALALVLLATSLFFCTGTGVVPVKAENNSSVSSQFYYSFDGVTSTTVPDKSGNGHNGTIRGSAKAGEGKIGNGMDFTNGGFTVDDGGGFEFSASGSYTLSLWVRPDTIRTDGVWQTIAVKDRQGDSYMGLYLYGSSFVYAMGKHNGSWPDIRVSGAEVGKWYNIALVQDGSQKKCFIYINGELKGTHDASYGFSGNGPWQFGGNIASNGEFFDGAMDEIRFYETALSSAQIQNTYNDERAVGQIAYWDFEGVKEGKIFDKSGNENNGKTVGTPDTRTDGISGTGLYMTADGDGFTAADADCFDFKSTDSFTLSCWIKPTALDGWRTVIAKNRESSDSYYGIFLCGKEVVFAMGRWNSAAGYKEIRSSNISTDTWYHVAIVQDGNAGTSSMYLNGAIVGSVDATFDYTGTGRWCVGGYGDSSTDSLRYEFYKGGIDEVKIYNLAMNEDAVKTQYDSVIGEDYKNDGTKYAVWEGEWPTFEEGGTPNIIFDTDIGGDSDDLGAAAILCAYAQQGKINLLGGGVTSALWSSGTLSAVFNYYGFGDLPVATRFGKYGFDYGCAYARHVSLRYSNMITDKGVFETPVSLYRRLLANAEDGSVTFCTTGGLTNLSDLLKSSPDEHSNLTGAELVAKKVKWVVAMGCLFPEGYECNIQADPAAAKYVNENWPTPIIYSGWEIGNPVWTAQQATLNIMGPNNPVSDGYAYHTQVMHYGTPRNSWDPITAYFASVGYDQYYELVRGDVKIADDAYNWFYPNEETGARAYLKPKGNITDTDMGILLDNVIMSGVCKNPNGILCDLIDDTDNRLVKTSTTGASGEYSDVKGDGTYYKTTDAGATIELTFSGKTVTVLGGLSSDGGMVDVYIDNSLVGTIDTYDESSWRWSNYLFHKTDLSRGEHTLKLVVSDQKNAASSGNAFTLDCIKVEKYGAESVMLTVTA